MGELAVDGVEGEPAPVVPVGGRDLMMAAAGVAALGLALASGSGSGGSVARLAPGLVGGVFGAFALTGPALLVAHQFLAVDAPVADVAAVLGRTVVRVGQVGWGFAPVSLMFALTAPGAGLWLLLAAGALLGGVAVVHAAAGLVALTHRRSWDLVVGVWIAVTVAVAARLALYSV